MQKKQGFLKSCYLGAISFGLMISMVPTGKNYLIVKEKKNG